MAKHRHAHMRIAPREHIVRQAIHFVSEEHGDWAIGAPLVEVDSAASVVSIADQVAARFVPTRHPPRQVVAPRHGTCLPPREPSWRSPCGEAVR